MRFAHSALGHVSRSLTHGLLVAGGVVIPLLVGIMRPTAAAAQARTEQTAAPRAGTAVSVGVDAGAAAVSYDDYDGPARVATVTPSVRWETTRSMVVANASISQFQSGNTSLQSGVMASLLTPEFWKLRGEVYGTVSATRYRQSLAATNVYGVGRLHATAPNGGVWVGAGGGFVAQNSGLPQAIGQLDAGVWARDENVLYTISTLPTHVGTYRYADINASMRWETSRTELALSSGYRARASDSTPGVQIWGEAWLTVWLARRLAVVTGAGVFPFDAVQGLPGGRYVSAGLRVVTRRGLASEPAVRAELTESYEFRRLARTAHNNGSAARFQVSNLSDGTRMLRLHVPGAHRVELMADFTDWSPVPLARGTATGEWCVAVVIGPGVHRVNVRVDEGEWQVPEGLTAVRDDFGGAVGILVVR